MVRLQYTIHQHNAKKAGPHFDLRLEKGNEVHSFALPKNKLPDDKHVYQPGTVRPLPEGRGCRCVAGKV